MRATGRGRNNDSFDPPLAQKSRDSDAGFASSRPSSVTAGRAISAVELYADRAFQEATIRYINAFFSSHSIPPISTKPSLAASAKDLSNILTSRLSLLVEVLDKEFVEKLEKEKEHVIQNCRALEKSVGELEAQAEGLRTGPTERETLEKEKNVLEEDVKKFQAMIAEFTARVAALEKMLEEKQKELNAKEEERNRICEENEELKNRVELQTFNARDVERMKREMQWRRKLWTQRLKIGNDFQYELNAKGSSPAEVMGFDYKTTLKPELESYADKIRESSKRKFEDLIVLQQQSKEMAATIEDKQTTIAALQSRTDGVEAQINLCKKEMQESDHRNNAEAKKMVDDVQFEAHNLDIAEREAAEIRKASQLRLQETIQQTEEEIQMHARQLFMVVDSVSKYKEHVESKISEMRISLSETAAVVSEAYKGSLPVQISGGASAR
ncbi:putative Transcription factor ICE1 [Hibiscus syriacus]|uniref:Transcription factor ICE1 n=1 Tax=Hibiscus syriacus TaxID=106335 RepID=A0A6A2X1N6_HIBSY|nr:putative Transcription factor ICE1 [Hibiscus syriacus]